jgi:hypothetical protein
MGVTSGAETAHPSGAPEFTPVFCGVCVTRSYILYLCFVDRCLSVCSFSFGHCIGQKIPKGQSEPVYRRRTDNTMAKRYQRGNQNQYIEEEQTTRRPKEKVQKDKQRSTKHTYKTKAN